MDLTKLKAEFPREAIHWRAQSIRKDGTAALAVAYIDARDVMERLDEVCGPANWQDKYECLANGTVICSVGVNVDNREEFPDCWVWKSDGAGKTDIEAEKGQISDAFKRAAVKWGIGRYLYDMPAIWVPCKCRDTGQKDKWGNIKWQWLQWTDDPWNHIKGAEKPAQQQSAPKVQAQARNPNGAAAPSEPPPLTIPHPVPDGTEAEWRKWISDVSQAAGNCAATSELAALDEANRDGMTALKAVWLNGHTGLRGKMRKRFAELSAVAGA